MAERRMFAKSVVCSDRFLDMPVSARELFFQLGMQTDDDGFVGNPKTVTRSCGASQDDLALLAAKGFVTLFESGVLHVADFSICNYIRKDRYTETAYLVEKRLLTCEGNQMGDDGLPDGIPGGDQTGAQVRLVEDRLVENRLVEEENPAKHTRFTPPTPQDVSAYASRKGISLDENRFCDFYAAKGWRVGSSPMRDWRAAARNWARRDAQAPAPRKAVSEYADDF